jgi:hypothetical protein
MTIAQILLQGFDTEMAGTRTILERVPEDKPELRCHEKSMALVYHGVHVSTLI